MLTQSNEKIELPEEVEARLNEWHRLYKGANRIHYILGVSAVLASALAASNPHIRIFCDYPLSQLLSAMAAALTAAIGFMQPNRTYLKFVSAWRVLDIACLKYRYGKIDQITLFLALEQAENLIDAKEKSNP